MCNGDIVAFKSSVKVILNELSKLGIPDDSAKKITAELTAMVNVIDRYYTK